MHLYHARHHFHLPFQPASPSARATLAGLTAPLFWGMSVGLVRSITSEFQAGAGLTLLYASAFIFLLFFMGWPRLSGYPKKYLFFGMPFANVSTVCYSFSLYFSQGGRQTVEVGMVNYLWPCLIVLFAVAFNGQKARWWMLPGVLISFCGIMLVLGGSGISPAEIMRHVMDNPASYLLALAGAIAWAAYSNFTQAWANGHNPTLIIFAIDIVLFSLLWAGGSGDIAQATGHGWISLALGAVAIGTPYAAWTYGAAKGNITLLAIGSYFTPVLSCLFASWWLGAALSADFWKGVALVVAGSLLCWSSTMNFSKAASEPENDSDR
ncbi:MAG: aromatic amino acid DMT transporter YddG [Mailhella sp.]|nr:aromatic amino acid DMT transporter YddG [Mailhella sp.]